MAVSIHIALKLSHKSKGLKVLNTDKHRLHGIQFYLNEFIFGQTNPDAKNVFFFGFCQLYDCIDIGKSSFLYCSLMIYKST